MVLLYALLVLAAPYLFALYAPHGGSLHYAPDTLKGRIFMGLERHLGASTDGIVFESAYSAKIYENNVHPRGAMETRIIPNGSDRTSSIG